MFDYNAELVRCTGIDSAPVHLVTGARLVSAVTMLPFAALAPPQVSAPADELARG